MSIVDDFDSLRVALSQLEDDKAKQIAETSFASGGPITVTISDEDRAKFYGMYGWGYQAPKEDAA